MIQIYSFYLCFQATPKIVKVDDDEESEIEEEIIERNLEQYNKEYPEVFSKNILNENDTHINLAIVGHVDSGKSTLIG